MAGDRRHGGIADPGPVVRRGRPGHGPLRTSRSAPGMGRFIPRIPRGARWRPPASPASRPDASRGWASGGSPPGASP